MARGTRLPSYTLQAHSSTISHRPRRDRLNSSTSHTPAAPIIKPAPTSTKGRRPAAFAISNAARASPATSRVLARRKESVPRIGLTSRYTLPEGGAIDYTPRQRHGQLRHSDPERHTQEAARRAERRHQEPCVPCVTIAFRRARRLPAARPRPSESQRRAPVRQTAAHFLLGHSDEVENLFCCSTVVLETESLMAFANTPAGSWSLALPSRLHPPNRGFFTAAQCRQRGEPFVKNAAQSVPIRPDGDALASVVPTYLFLSRPFSFSNLKSKPATLSLSMSVNGICVLPKAPHPPQA